MNREETRVFTRRVLITVGIVTAVALILLLSWKATNVLLLLFAGVLLAVFLNGISQWITNHTRIPYKITLVLVVVGLVLLLGAGWAWAAPSLIQQAGDLSEGLVSTLQSERDMIAGTEWGQTILAQMPTLDEIIASPQSLLANVTNIFATAINALTGIIVIFFVGLYLAYEPNLYRDGLVQLVPFQRRERAREVLAILGNTMRHWLKGRFVAMVAIGATTVLGLSLIGVPLAFILGVLAGLLDFIPFVGPLIAVVPALIIAAASGSEQLLYVVILFLAIQAIEGYFLTPLVERQAVSMPFAITIMAQVFFGLLAGLLGVALASPLAAAILVLLKMLYVEDVLGDHNVELPTEEEAQPATPTPTDGKTPAVVNRDGVGVKEKVQGTTRGRRS